MKKWNIILFIFSQQFNPIHLWILELKSNQLQNWFPPNAHSSIHKPSTHCFLFCAKRLLVASRSFPFRGNIFLNLTVGISSIAQINFPSMSSLQLYLGSCAFFNYQMRNSLVHIFNQQGSNQLNTKFQFHVAKYQRNMRNISQRPFSLLSSHITTLNSFFCPPASFHPFKNWIEF